MIFTGCASKSFQEQIEDDKRDAKILFEHCKDYYDYQIIIAGNNVNLSKARKENDSLFVKQLLTDSVYHSNKIKPFLGKCNLEKKSQANPFRQ